MRFQESAAGPRAGGAFLAVLPPLYRRACHAPPTTPQNYRRSAPSAACLPSCYRPVVRAVRLHAERRCEAATLAAGPGSATVDPISAESALPGTAPWMAVLGWLWKGALAMAVACLLAFASPQHAEAARSGGRMGGSAFRSGGMGATSSYSGSSSFLGRSPVRTRSPTQISVGFGPTFGFGYGYPMVFGGGGMLNILIFGMVAYGALQVLSNYQDGGDVGGSFGSERVAVGRVQVGLLGSARQLQKDLTRIAKRADTSDVEGLQYILQETVLALNRNPDYWVYGASSLRNSRDSVAAEKRLNEFSLEERSKIKEETLSNFSGRTKQATITSPGEGVNEFIVVTILVAVGGGMRLPRVTSREDLRAALNRLGAIGTQSLMAVEVLWTPQDESDAYTRDELLEDYPSMYTL